MNFVEYCRKIINDDRFAEHIINGEGQTFIDVNQTIIQEIFRHKTDLIHAAIKHSNSKKEVAVNIIIELMTIGTFISLKAIGYSKSKLLSDDISQITEAIIEVAKINWSDFLNKGNYSVINDQTVFCCLLLGNIIGLTFKQFQIEKIFAKEPSR